MTEDFRSLLKESMKDESSGERWFEDIEIGNVFFFSIQASSLHASTPAELLDDVNKYESFQVVIQSKPGIFAHGRRGAWQHLETKPWWPLFEADSPIVHMAENVPVSTVQQIYDDLKAIVAAHPEMLPKKCGCLKPC